ncbi:hypothetical protein [Paenibacillus rigui]|uniref:hypothetical protein n=1 Tax=Paenibacillus rigui TaxID=554312 RepID=UPI00117CB99F|nr:hypothetical protein [Paenibacillus rigui]
MQKSGFEAVPFEEVTDVLNYRARQLNGIHDLTPTSIKKENRLPVAVCSLVIFDASYFDIKGIIEHHFTKLHSV